MSQALDQLLQKFSSQMPGQMSGRMSGHMPHVWTGRELARTRARSTGFRDLNGLLPGHGWPLSAVIELIPAAEGIGELSLLLPALTQLCREARDIVFVRPPHVPYPPGLTKAGLPLNRILWIDADNDGHARWAAEQTLREGLAGAVLLWSDCNKDVSLRRLQLAARESDALTFLYRPPGSRVLPSPAAVRLHLSANHSSEKPSEKHGALNVEVLKAQGGRTGSVLLDHRSAA